MVKSVIIGLSLIPSFAFLPNHSVLTQTAIFEMPSATSTNRVMPTGDATSDVPSLIVTTDYFIGPEDVLEISIWRNMDLSRSVTVRPDGKISIPLIGDIVAVGKTASQLSEAITARLKEYKENPQVSIVVTQVNSYAFYLLGEVNKPGKYPLKSRTTLLHAITLAGGFTSSAARNKIVVFRFGEDRKKDTKIRASFDEIVLHDNSIQNIEMKPGDTVVVPSETMVLVP